MVIRRILIFLVLLNLIYYFNIIRPDRIFYFTILPGISLNISDLLSIFMFVVSFFYALFSEDKISRELVYLLIYFFSSIILVCGISFLALDASLGTVGNRLRLYFCYFFIPGTIYLIKDKTDLKFFFGVVFVFGAVGCLIQYAEFIYGKPFFYIPGTGVGEYFSSKVMKVEGISRIWHRSGNYLMFTCGVSMSCVLLRQKGKRFFMFLLIGTLISIIVSFTRTAYMFTIIAMLVITFICLRKNFASSILVWVIIFVLLASCVCFGLGKGTMNAFVSRFASTSTAITDAKTPSTFHERMKQLDYIMEKMRKSNYPTIFGMGITNESVKLVTSDLGYINIFLNLGVLGLIFVVWIYVYLYRKCFRLKKSINEGFYNCVLIGIIGILSGMIVAGINFDYFTLKSKFPLLFVCIVSVELIDKFHRKGVLA